jgi:WhiB family redox-sensing transcriptional regulator
MNEDTSFMEQAKCKGMDTNFFFPPGSDPSKIKQAIAFCKTCPVKTPCAQYAIDNNINHGVFGGLSIRSRTKLKREQKLTLNI